MIKRPHCNSPPTDDQNSSSLVFYKNLIYPAWWPDFQKFYNSDTEDTLLFPVLYFTGERVTTLTQFGLAVKGRTAESVFFQQQPRQSEIIEDFYGCVVTVCVGSTPVLLLSRCSAPTSGRSESH